MKSTTFTFKGANGKDVFAYKWLPDSGTKAVIVISHGMAEHAGRYARLAEVLTAAGIAVYAEDHRAHGKTAANPDDLGHYEKGDFKGIVDDLKILLDLGKSETKAKKAFLLGHSMGSFISQGFIATYGSEIDGCVLSGTSGTTGALINVGNLLASIACVVKGKRKRSPMLDGMSFGAFNKPFEPNRTKFDWLSRDNAEVDKYVADPFCGFIATCGFFKELTDGLLWIYNPATQALIPKNLPLFLVAGAKDPVGGATGTFQALVDLYKKIGIQDVSSNLYLDARHEIFNETNRAEISKNVVDWLKERMK